MSIMMTESNFILTRIQFLFRSCFGGGCTCCEVGAGAGKMSQSAIPLTLSAVLTKFIFEKGLNHSVRVSSFELHMLKPRDLIQ